MSNVFGGWAQELITQAKIVSKLKAAQQEESEVVLSADEVKTLVYMLQLLSSGVEK
jgi:hypothetical protein